MQAITLIGKQGSIIKAIQETTGCAIRVFSAGTNSIVNFIVIVIHICIISYRILVFYAVNFLSGSF